MSSTRPPAGDARHYHLVHRTTYTYPQPVTSSYGRAVLLPRSAGGQTCHWSELRTDPIADEIAEHRDFHGNRSSYFSVTDHHTVLDVVAESVLTVNRRTPQVDRIPPVSWEQAVHVTRSIRSSGARVHGDHEASVVAVADGALASPMVEVTEAARTYANPSFTPGRSVGHVVRDLTERIYRDFTYSSGSTNVRTGLTEVLDRRMGVCQDFAHVLVAAARSMGLAARYVSGYIETRPREGQPKLRGVDASHAWAAVWVPHGGWVQTDPTNNQFVDNRYVVLGWGRDYRDVSPLRGIVYTQGSGSTLSVGVDLIPVDEEELQRLVPERVTARQESG
jgi:transglutaminase-like putative cysteine protease